MAGLTNGQYADWLSDTAHDDCSSVDEVFIKYTDDTEETLTSGICTGCQMQQNHKHLLLKK